MTVTNKNFIQEEMKGKLNSGYASYHSVSKLLSSRPLSENIEIRIYNNAILTVVLIGVKLVSHIIGRTQIVSG
jgi:hypothetical protein